MAGGIILSEKRYFPVAVAAGAGAYEFRWGFGAAAAHAYVAHEGSNTTYGTADFLDASASWIQQHLWLPADWYAPSGIDLRLLWMTAVADISKNVVWQVSTAFVADNADLDPAFNAAQILTDAAKASASRLNVATLPALTLTGAVASALMFLKVARDPAHASDTLGGTASLIGVELTYRRLVTIE